MWRVLAGFVVIGVQTVGAQESRCDTLQSQVTLGSLSGRRIDSVLVQTAPPSLGKLGRSVSRLHVRTRDNVVRRELLFSAGDTVDTLAIAESLRHLRTLAFLAHAQIEARRCSSPAGETLALTVLTRDSWTTRPDLRGGSGSRIGLTERNLLGTGVSTRAQYQRYTDGSLRGLMFSRRQASLSDSWRASLDISDQQHDPRTPLSDNF